MAGKGETKKEKTTKKTKDDTTKENKKSEEKQKNNINENLRPGGAIIPGTILIMLGLIFMLDTTSLWHIEKSWPLIVGAPGISFLLWYMLSSHRQKISGLIIPGVIISLISVFFLTLNYVGWQHMANFWPLFILIPGISFFAFDAASEGRYSGIRIPAWILSVMGLSFLVIALLSATKLWPVLFIAAGLSLLFIRPKK